MTKWTCKLENQNERIFCCCWNDIISFKHWFFLALNNWPFCQKEDYSKKTDINSRTVRWMHSNLTKNSTYSWTMEFKSIKWWVSLIVWILANLFGFYRSFGIMCDILEGIAMQSIWSILNTYTYHWQVYINV